MAKADVIRTIWFIPGHPMPGGTIVLLECSDHQEVESRCREFPFIIDGIAGLEVIPITPCTAYELLFEEASKP